VVRLDRPRDYFDHEAGLFLLYNYRMNVDTFNRLVFLVAFGLVAWRCIIAAQVGLDAQRRAFTPQGQTSMWTRASWPDV
jgi:hypothetical protein